MMFKNNHTSQNSIPQAVFSIKDGYALQIAQYIINLSFHYDEVYVSQETIASRLRILNPGKKICRETVNRIIRHLRDIRFLNKNRKEYRPDFKSPCVYTLNPILFREPLRFIHMFPQLKHWSKRTLESFLPWLTKAFDQNVTISYLRNIYSSKFFNNLFIKWKYSTPASVYYERWSTFQNNCYQDVGQFDCQLPDDSQTIYLPNDSQIPNNSQTTHFKKILEEIEEEESIKKEETVISPLIISPLLQSITDILHLTDHGKAKLMAFDEAVLQAALTTYKKQAPQQNPFKWLVQYCVLYSNQQNIKIDWYTYFLIRDRYNLKNQLFTAQPLIAQPLKMNNTYRPAELPPEFDAEPEYQKYHQLILNGSVNVLFDPLYPGYLDWVIKTNPENADQIKQAALKNIYLNDSFLSNIIKKID